MHTQRITTIACSVFAALACGIASAAGTYQAANAEEEPWEKYISERLEVGISLANASMDKTHVPYDRSQHHNFLGNINNLDEDETLGIGIVVRYSFIDYLAVEASNDIHARLRTENMDGDTCDGAIELDGWRVQLIAKYPFDFDTFIVEPYLGLGLAFLSCSYSHENWWHYGWSSPEDYARNGHGSTSPHNGATRNMDLSDPDTTPVITIGSSFVVSDHVVLDVFWRDIDADPVKVDFYREENGRHVPMRKGEFPIAHSALGCSVRYLF